MQYSRMMSGSENSSEDISVSRLGLGCMRLPLLPDGKIDINESERLIDLAYNEGINYFDTAVFYHNGMSESILGKTLGKYPRSTYYIADKLPVWLLRKSSDIRSLFFHQLKKLNTEYIDFYLFHGLGRVNFDLMKQFNALNELIKLKQEGKIKFLGFSFHDTYEVFEEILNYYNWDFCQIQFNYFDKDTQAGIKGYNLANKSNIPVFVMEPVKGGNLAAFSEKIDNMFYKLNPERSISSYALRWVAEYENVKVILSGMSSLQQLQDNLNTFIDVKPLTVAEKELIDSVTSLYEKSKKNSCSMCRYCDQCPEHVQIYLAFEIWNKLSFSDGIISPSAAGDWNRFIKQSLDKCKNCGKCEALCPQKINIRNNLKQAYTDIERAINNAD